MTQKLSTRMRRQSPQRESGQAAVEAALTLPLVVFLVLGVMQMVLVMQARSMAHYAAFKATRVGSINQGDCERMTHAAVAALMPVFTRVTDSSGNQHARVFGEAFGARLVGGGGGRIPMYNPALDGGLDGAVVWITRDEPRPPFRHPTDSRGRPIYETFDQPVGERQSLAGVETMSLKVRMIFWAPLRIPLANMVISEIARAHFGLQEFAGSNPLMMARDRNWTRGSGSLDAAVAEELQRRAMRDQYVLPIEASYQLRMMTPPHPKHFASQNCPPAPEFSR